MRILYAEDERSLSEAVVDILVYHNYTVDAVYDGETALAYAQLEEYDGIILDIMMPKKNGLEVMRELRRNGCNTPIMILTAKSEIGDQIIGLDAGADDYMTKPFGVMELISRVKALLRRSKPENGSDKVLTLGGVILDRDRHAVYVDGMSVELTYKEFELLQLLMTNAGVVSTRERILEKVWGTDFEGESRTLDMHIKTLRQKLGDAGGMIKTVRNVGYFMNRN